MSILSKKNTFYALYAMGAFAFFLWFLFPTDFFADYLEVMIRKHGNGMVVSIDDARPSLLFSLSLKGVTCEVPNGPRITADTLNVRPGLVSLIQGNPEVSFSTTMLGGRISGQVIVPENNPEKMSVENLSVSNLDLFAFKDLMATYLPGYTVTGRVDAQGNYSSDGRGNGSLTLVVKDLAVEPDKAFFTITRLSFPEVKAEVELKSKKIQIQNCVVDGDEVDGTLTGSIFIRTPVDRSTLRLSGTVKPEKAFMEKLGASVPIDALVGNKMNADGEIPFSISGVASAPRYSLK